MRFEGTVIITDPCYIMRAKHHGTTPITEDDWSACEWGENMEKLGIHTYMTRNTIYGDWSCTVYDSDTHKKLGDFCADAGLVSVFLLDEVLEYNPDFTKWMDEHPWCVTKIENFIGEVTFEVINDEVQVIGKGNINFEGYQTGL